MDQITYTAATEADIPFIRDTYHANMEALHGVPRSYAVWQTLLSDKNSAYYILRTPEPAGWLRIDFEGSALCLGMLQIAPTHQRRGIGRAALSFLEKLAADGGFPTVIIHTTEDNLPARALYAAAGYTVTEIGPCTTADGKDRTGYTFQKIL